jgi:hypothetical protein
MSKLKILSRLAAIGVFLTFMFSACYNYNDDETTLSDLDITLTYYDTTFNFQSYSTFAIRDSVGVLSNYLDDEDLAEFYGPNGGNEKIKQNIRDHFTALGYTEVQSDDDYDFGVNMVVMLVNSTYVYYPGWWYGYYDYYYWYWGGWYPYYPYYPWGGYYAYNYQTGTLLIEMTDGQSIRDYRAWAAGKTDSEIENADPDEVPDILFRWQALVNGVAGDNASYNQERAKDGIDQAFKQSPYLEKN